MFGPTLVVPGEHNFVYGLKTECMFVEFKQSCGFELDYDVTEVNPCNRHITTNTYDRTDIVFT